MEYKRHLKKFENISTYESQKDEVMGMPHVVLLDDTKEMVFASENNETPQDPFNGYEYVDLGLSSGTLWATKPITNADSEPLYFQCGDTEGWTAEQIQNGEKAFALYDYKWYKGSMTKYNATDGKTILDLEDDAAHVHMGGDWHMPTKEQFEELITNTTSTWTSQNGINGKLFTASNGNSIFIPAFNYVDGTNISIGNYGSVLTNLISEDFNNVFFFSFGSSYSFVDIYSRASGYIIFGVIGK